MCGVVGYKGKNIKVADIIESLKLLEYRGYDSAGIAFNYNGDLVVQKNEGKIDKLLINFNGKYEDISSNIVIAHTRWATHGVPNDINAHPHIDCTKKIAVVHNGIIENYKEIKEELINKGHNFISDTDSEVLSHLIEEFLNKYNNLFEVSLEVVKKIKGAFAFVAISNDLEELVAVRYESPLIIGIYDNNYIIASDIPSILRFTKKIIVLENGDIFFINKKNEYKIYNFIIDKEIKRPIEFVSWDISIAEKSGYKHFMLKEIMEQPKVIKDTLLERINIDSNTITLDDKVKNLIDLKINDINSIVYLACGTSYHAGLLGRYYTWELTDLNTDAFYASEYRYINKNVNLDKILYIVISQSGETADTLFVARELKKLGANIIGIPNVIGSSLYREFISFNTRAGIEIGVAATKTFTAQIIAILLLNLYISSLKNKDNLILKDLIQDLAHIHIVVDKFLEDYIKIQEIAIKYKDYEHFLYLGRNLMYPVALEGALKLKEISYIHAEAYPSGEMKHGPIALIDSKMPTMYLAPYNDLIYKNLSNIQEIKARKGIIIALVDNKSVDIVKDYVDDFIVLPYVNKFLQPILFNIALQLFAYFVADLKGLDVDQPRNLAKSVTVE
ncbi:MAG: glutamine--fructose-6-phosphate transaminase (isomerizing) [bacterium]|nr:glutamine--fructose-6-phosphate transaminase (isomerizing) [bacterium]